VGGYSIIFGLAADKEAWPSNAVAASSKTICLDEYLIRLQSLDAALFPRP
jgi:hypothetical protein